MTIRDIVGIIRMRFYLGLVVVAGLATILAIGYFFIYRKVFGGKRKFTLKEIILGFALVGYITMVLGVTLMGRGDHFKGAVNFHFFSSYRDAWNSFGLMAWQQLILNILMFLPLGILLPLINPKFQRLKNTMTIALALTIFIELVQLISGRGVFELDDMVNNFLGALIGYGIVMSILAILNKKERLSIRILKYLSPLIISIGIFASIFILYQAKEFGNINIAHSYRLDMKNIDVKMDGDLNLEEPKVPIYKAPTYDKVTGKKFAIEFFHNLGLDTGNLDISQYSKSGVYWLRGDPSYNIWLNYDDGSYSFGDFSSFDKGVEVVSSDKANLVKELGNFNIDIPSEAAFSQIENGKYSFDLERQIEGDKLWEGFISCGYYNDGTIKDISNYLITYTKVRDIAIKSEKDAYDDFMKGKFSYYNFSKDIGEILIKDINLDYYLDTKGYYQPVYIFSCLIDGEKHNIVIPAL